MKLTAEEMNKLQDVIFYICKKAEDLNLQLFSIPLSKIIFLADRKHYLLTSKPIVADAYVRGKNGPYLKELRIGITYLQNNNYIKLTKINIGRQIHTLYSLGLRSKYYNMQNLTRVEKNILDKNIISVITGATAEAISASTHNHAWRTHTNGEYIPLCEQLFTEPAKITNADKEWAKEILAEM